MPSFYSANFVPVYCTSLILITDYVYFWFLHFCFAGGWCLEVSVPVCISISRWKFLDVPLVEQQILKFAFHYNYIIFHPTVC